MDLHKLFQLCHVLKCFPSFPSPPIAPCTPDLLGHDLLLLHCIQQLPGLFLFFCSFSTGALSIFEAWPGIPK